MADVARRVVRMLEGSLGHDDIRIVVEAESLQVDAAVATPLAVILNELVQNAVEHGLGHGSGVVTVHLHGGHGQAVELEVVDDGAGPAEPAIPTEYSGVGLRLVRALVNEDLGGSFTLIARPGRGSIARARIPPPDGN